MKALSCENGGTVGEGTEIAGEGFVIAPGRSSPDRGEFDYTTDNTPRSLRFFSLTFPTHKSTRPPHSTTTLRILRHLRTLVWDREKG